MESIKERIEQERITILFQTLNSGMRGSVFQKDNRWYIIVNQHDPPERQNFTLAHEYFEIQLNERDDISVDEKHYLANRLAAEFLLPDAEFERDLQTHDLHELKKAFPGVSYEVIARRLPYFRPVVVSILDNMKLTSRFASPSLQYPRNMSPIELQVARCCYDTKDRVIHSEPPLHITGFYLIEIHGIERVFIITEIDE